MMGDEPPEALSEEDKSRLILEETFAKANKKHQKHLDHPGRHTRGLLK